VELRDGSLSDPRSARIRNIVNIIGDRDWTPNLAEIVVIRTMKLDELLILRYITVTLGGVGFECRPPSGEPPEVRHIARLALAAKGGLVRSRR